MPLMLASEQVYVFVFHDISEAKQRELMEHVFLHELNNIPVDVAQQLFKQRTSTKGPGRGLGLYAVQLFGEQCLSGQVTFESMEEAGIVFRFELPNGKLATVTK